MDIRKFREIERQYRDLKERQAAGDISPEDMKAELKKMMLRDEDNRYWMLGGKTGGWYVYDGTSWNAEDPYPDEESPPAPRAQDAAPQEKSPPAAAQEARPLAVEKAEPLCKFCRSRLEAHDTYCRFCGGNQKAAAKPPERRFAEDEIHLKSVRILSLILFFGGLGLVAGVILGASFGIFKILGDLIYQFPVMLQEMRGKIQGGLFFGAIGGIAGFAGFALLAALLGMLYNALAFVFGGLRFKIKS